MKLAYGLVDTLETNGTSQECASELVKVPKGTHCSRFLAMGCLGVLSNRWQGSHTLECSPKFCCPRGVISLLVLMAVANPWACT
jgi:hypothetical protein